MATQALKFACGCTVQIVHDNRMVNGTNMIGRAAQRRAASGKPCRRCESRHARKQINDMSDSARHALLHLMLDTGLNLIDALDECPT